MRHNLKQKSFFKPKIRSRQNRTALSEIQYNRNIHKKEKHNKKQKDIEDTS